MVCAGYDCTSPKYYRFTWVPCNFEVSGPLNSLASDTVFILSSFFLGYCFGLSLLLVVSQLLLRDFGTLFR